MKKVLLVALGTGATAYLVRRVQSAAESITPEGISDRRAGWRHGMRLLREDMRQAREQREAELRARWPRSAADSE